MSGAVRAEPQVGEPQPTAVQASSELERLMGPPRWHPRPPGEWDGMRVNLNLTPPCDGPSLCGLARACKDGKCGPCVADAECGTGEVCVLDHCVRSENASCRRSADCGGKSVCLLSGYSNDVRGNGDMRAYCVNPESGASRLAPMAETPPAPDPRASLPDDELLKAAQRARAE